MTDEVKKAVETLRYCEETGARCGGCPSGMDENGVPICHSSAHIADLIESLAAELEQVRREREAAMEDLEKRCECNACAHQHHRSVEAYIKSSCMKCVNFCNWQWVGVKESSDA